MTQTGQSPRILHADPEHGGIRFIIVVILLLGLILGFIVIQLLLSLLASDTILIEFATALSCTGAIILALALAWASETYLKRVWHSGTRLELGQSQLAYLKAHKITSAEESKYEEMFFDWSKNINITRWYFDLDGYPRAGRERQISSKWLCLACQIQQDEARMIVHGYFPPQEAEPWINNQRLAEPFQPISMAKLYNETGRKKRGVATRPAVPSHMLTGASGRYWLAEQKRWREGVELTRADFTTLMEYVEQQL